MVKRSIRAGNEAELGSEYQPDSLHKVELIYRPVI